jgi:hypothetical protein
VTIPCPTCRQKVEHRIALDLKIHELTPPARINWRRRGRLRQYKQARLKVIRSYAEHLLEHTETDQPRKVAA